MVVNLVALLHLATLLARAAHQAPVGRPAPAVVHVLDQKVFNLNPDYFSYTLTALRWSGRGKAQARHWRRRCA